MFKNFFDLENYREACARRNDDKAFLATYKDASLPTIVNENTSLEWETQLDDIASVQDKMTSDRIVKTSRLVREISSVSTILDIGIGNGWVEKELFSHDNKKFTFFGLDITPRNLKKLEKTLPGTYYVGDAISLPKKLVTKTFSCVLMLEVLEHISPQNTFKALENVKKLLRRSGHFIISVPIYEDLEEKIQQNRNISKHVRRYTPDIVKKELELAGFYVQSASYFYAFSSFYVLKSLVAKITGLRKPNVMLIHATRS